MRGEGADVRGASAPAVASDRTGALAVFLVALVPRLYVALAWGAEPVWDGHYYDFGARRIAAGFGYSDDLTLGGQAIWHPWCHYPVGYSAALALFYRVFGATQTTAAGMNASVGALLALVTFALARSAFCGAKAHVWRARLAGLFVALHPGLVLYAALVMTEPLAALLTMTAFWIVVRDRPRPSRLSGVLGAIVLGVAALVRPQALLCAPFLGAACVTWPRPFDVRRALRPAAVALALTVVPLVPVLPWTARNCRVMDGCALVSTNGGWNLAIGAFPRATGRFETLRASDGCREVTGQVQQDRCWFAYGVSQIAQAKGRWLSLIPKKLGFTFDHESFAVEYLHEARPADWPEPRRTAARDLTTLVHRLLLCAAALGCVAFRIGGGRASAAQGALLALLGVVAFAGFSADSPLFWPMAIAVALLPWLPIPGAPPSPWALRLPVSLLATTLVTHAIFFGEDRYHVVVTPVLCLLAAAALRRSGRISTLQKHNGANALSSERAAV